MNAPPLFPNSWTAACVNIELECKRFFQDKPDSCLEQAFQMISTPFVCAFEQLNRCTYTCFSCLTGQESTLDEQVARLYRKILAQNLLIVPQKQGAERYQLVDSLIRTFARKKLEDILPGIQAMENSGSFFYQQLAPAMLEREQKRWYHQQVLAMQKQLPTTSKECYARYLVLITPVAKDLTNLLLYKESVFLFLKGEYYVEQKKAPPPFFWALVLCSYQKVQLCEQFPPLLSYWFDMLRERVRTKPQPFLSRESIQHFCKSSSGKGPSLVHDPKARLLALYHNCSAEDSPQTKKPWLICFYHEETGLFQLVKYTSSNPKGSPSSTPGDRLEGPAAIKEMFSCIHQVIETHAISGQICLYAH
ncbi:MAG: hypothetical protein FJZ58_02710 [Chlamydiae bacterium]|nr:hypothetical protein [Chlamydiota bacterium]